MFQTYERILVRWRDGHVLVGPWGYDTVRREQFLEVRGIETAEAARELGESLLAVYRDARASRVVAGPVLTSGQRPGQGYRVGDAFDGQVVQAYAITLGDEGITMVTPELGDPIAIRYEQLMRHIERANAGVTSEWASPWAPGQQPGRPQDSSVPTFTLTAPEGFEGVFSYPGTLAPSGASGTYQPPREAVLVGLEASKLGDGTVTFALLKNGAVLSHHSFTNPTGQWKLSVPWTPADRLAMQITGVAGSASDLVVQARYK